MSTLTKVRSLALLEAGDLMAASELNVRMWVDGPNRQPEQVSASVRDRVREMQHLAFTVPVPDGCELAVLEPLAITRLNEVQAPTLVIVGDQDVPGTLAAGAAPALSHDRPFRT